MPALRDRMLGFYRTWLSIADLEVPTIAAINGAAVGAGLCFALACDLVYAAEDAKLLVPFTALGLHPGMAATYLLPRVAGVGVAREMLLTGRTMLGAEAASAGLVTRAFPGRRCSPRCWRSHPGPRPTPRSRPGSPRSLSPAAGMRIWRPHCAGNPWLSR
nr:hypothetical protein GCM10020093_059270 [Planobispora longispora]